MQLMKVYEDNAQMNIPCVYMYNSAVHIPLRQWSLTENCFTDAKPAGTMHFQI